MNWVQTMVVARQLLALVIASVAFGAPQQDEPRFGRGPWIFLQRGTELAAAPVTRFDSTGVGAAQIRLDDGRIATVRVVSEPCAEAQRCEPDCGCHVQDRYRLSVKDIQGALITETHIWVAYGFLNLSTADLVGGPGDELLIVRPLGRSAPPNGVELKILQVTGAGIRELLASHQIAGNLSGTPMVCGQWRGRVLIDANARKPRTLTVRNEVMVPTGCALDEESRATAAGLQRPVILEVGTRAGGLQERNATLIAAAQQVDVRTLEGSLPSMAFADWLNELVGTAAQRTWTVKECDPPERSRPLCVEVDVRLPQNRQLLVSLMVGTEATGVRPPEKWRMMMTEPSGEKKRIGWLFEIPVALGIVNTPPIPVTRPIEFRLAEASPAPGLVPAQVVGSFEVLHVESLTRLDDRDIVAASVGEQRYDNRVVVVRLTAAGVAKFNALATRGPWQRVAIIARGRLISAPRIDGAIHGDVVHIVGLFTADEASELAAALSKPR